MRQRYTSFLFTAALMLTGCAVSDDVFTGTEEREARELADNIIRFDTYMGGNYKTRSGYEGSIDTDVLKDGTKAKGFGVFAYYSGTQTYNDKNGTGTNGASGTMGPNFMYNEKIVWNPTGLYWDYANQMVIKYWPNEVQEGAVDDQDPAATTEHANGGKLSFFAYAPFTGTSDQAAGTPSHDNTRGISKLTGNATTTDPIVNYIIAADGKVVDLLWGTYGETNTNVLGTGNAGVVSTDATAAPGLLYPIANRTSYASDILKGYRTNADLTKQKTNGRVGFNFKHALAKVGGSNTTTSPSTTNGMMIVLDIDKDGALTGGTKVPFTLVTVESIVIKANKVEYDSDNNGSLDKTDYVTGGSFNLATGKWFNLTTGNSGDAITHIIGTTANDANAGVINHTIAEPDHNSSGYAAGTVTINATEYPRLDIKNGASLAETYIKAVVDGVLYTSNDANPYLGVLTTAKNVYENESSPLVFIPGTKPSFNITITYYVRTLDPFLNATVASGGEGTWTRVKQTISKDVTFADVVELNKQYNILIHLGLTSVKFTASVSDWDVNNTGSDDDHDGVVDLIVEDAHLPINVAEATATKAYSAGTTALDDVSAGTTQVTLTVTGLSDGTYAAASDAGNPAGDAISPASVTLDGGGSAQTQVLVMTLAPNTGTTDVTHTFTFGSATYTVKQKAGPLSVKATTSSFAYDVTNVDPGFSVKNYGGGDETGVTFTKSDAWITDITASTGALTLSKNETTRDRSAIITATKGNATGTATITQAHAPISLTATPAGAVVTLAVTNEANSSAITLYDNYTLTVAPTVAFTDDRAGHVTLPTTGTYTFTVTINDASATASGVSVTVP